MRATRRLLIWLATLLAWATLGAGAGLGVAVVGPIALGWHPLVVLSGSMAPALQIGDEIVVEPIAPVALRVGDVVTFDDASRGHVLVTHRVRDVRVAGSTVHVVTRGDANDGSEHWSVAAGGRVGRVAYRVPKLGYVTVAAGTPLGRILLVVVPAILLGASEIRRVWRPRAETHVSASTPPPPLQAGDEVVVKPVAPFAPFAPVAPVAPVVGDVVAFDDASRGHVLVTDRIRDVRVADPTVHVVAGDDANDGSERSSVAAGGRVERVANRESKLGHVTVTPLGRILLVVVPAVLLGASEVRRVRRAHAGTQVRRPGGR